MIDDCHYDDSCFFCDYDYDFTNIIIDHKQKILQ